MSSRNRYITGCRMRRQSLWGAIITQNTRWCNSQERHAHGP